MKLLRPREVPGVVFGLFSVISLVGYSAMRQSADLYRRTWSRSSAQRELRRAEVALGRDLLATAGNVTSRGNGPTSLGPPDGDALWMLNAASLGAGPAGTDDHCPHKVLIRKVIDTGTAADPADPNTQEQLASNLNAYLTRPNGTDVSGMLAEPGVRDVRVVGVNLLGFNTTVGPGIVAITLRATALEEAQKSLAVGSVSLATVAPTLTHEMSVFPRN